MDRRRAALTDNLLTELMADFQPTTATQQLLVERLATCFWRLRRAMRLLAPLFAAAALALGALAMFPHPSAEQVLISMSIAYFFVSTINIGVYLYTPELYPTRVRALGVGTATAWLRFASIIGPMVVGAMIGTRLTPAQVPDLPKVFLAFAAVAAIAAAITALFAVETKGRVLEEASP